MIVFAFIGVYMMPVIGFLFIVLLLRAIQKIVNKKPYTVELVWSGLLFALIVWTLSMLALVNEWSN
ncbi:hypothetical protein PCCS19_26220 [Paenibacillus sp. CCS19]|uniref:hypothetical protein n=1 Tax=Paenibacillus sp. CCS19 TaxID=3158387 RepID=UPI00256E6CBC|nr:hypothetical protein [Paenibacillus cellulosilyticus]GMK39568.1 hypothetical protein PCCS19_26220 [Paenibacillus cellulosilyticus]